MSLLEQEVSEPPKSHNSRPNRRALLATLVTVLAVGTGAVAISSLEDERPTTDPISFAVINDPGPNDQVIQIGHNFDCVDGYRLTAMRETPTAVFIDMRQVAADGLGGCPPAQIGTGGWWEVALDQPLGDRTIISWTPGKEVLRVDRCVYVDGSEC